MPLDEMDWLAMELDYIDRHDVITDDREPWEEELWEEIPDYDPYDEDYE
jgi:hypothetical protein